MRANNELYPDGFLLLYSDDTKGGLSDAFTQIPWQGTRENEARKAYEEVSGGSKDQTDESF